MFSDTLCEMLIDLGIIYDSTRGLCCNKGLFVVYCLTSMCVDARRVLCSIIVSLCVVLSGRYTFIERVTDKSVAGIDVCMCA